MKTLFKFIKRLFQAKPIYIVCVWCGGERLAQHKIKAHYTSTGKICKAWFGVPKYLLLCPVCKKCTVKTIGGYDGDRGEGFKNQEGIIELKEDLKEPSELQAMVIKGFCKKNRVLLEEIAELQAAVEESNKCLRQVKQILERTKQK